MKFKLKDLIDMEHFQNLQDRLNEIYSFPSAIIDNEGNILTATAWQDVCTKFHRKNRESEEHCIQSDKYILSHLHEANPAVSYRCPHGMVDNATPIIIDGIHYGNFFTGQFFLEPPDMEFFKKQARRYGFDEASYLEAVRKVPIWTQEQLNNYLFFIKGLITVISESGLKRLKEVETRRKIEEGEEKYRSLFENMMQGVFRQRSDGVLLDVNPAALKMFGLTREEFLGRTSENPEWEVIGEDGTPIPGAEHPSMAALRTGKPVIGRMVGVRNALTRDWVWMEINAIPEFHSGEAYPRQVMVTMQDVTQRKRAEEEKMRLQAQLIQAQKMESIGRLAGGVAHDFNNMLGIIIGNAEMSAMQVDPDEPLYQNLQEIIKASHRSADTVRQLLAFARRQTISPRIMDLNDTVSGMLNMLRRLIGENIELIWGPGNDLGKVRMDPSQVNQILANLLVNSRDAIPGVGRITIETDRVLFDEEYCREHAGSSPGKHVLLAVSDTGAGMSREVMEHLFDPFFTTKEVGRGTGLGLATVYGIVTQNNGSIDVQSEPGKGTTFRIYFPEVEEGVIAAPERAREAALTGTETILITEDELPLLNIARDILTNQGYAVLVAKTPTEALALSEKHRGEIHLLLTDVVMPEMNGRQLAERLRLNRPGLKCLFMSGYTADVVAHHGVLDEGVHFIEKPFSPRVLAEKVREVLDRGGKP